MGENSSFILLSVSEEPSSLPMEFALCFLLMYLVYFIGVKIYKKKKQKEEIEEEHISFFRKILRFIGLFGIAMTAFYFIMGFVALLFYGNTETQMLSIQFGIVLIIIIIICFLAYIISDFFSKPFKYPSISDDIDLSSKRRPFYDEYIDKWLIEYQDYTVNEMFEDMLREWDEKCEDYLSRTWFWKKHKRKLYEKMRDEVLEPDYPVFKFTFFRCQTRYRQVNYQKIPYTVGNVEKIIKLTVEEMQDIENELIEIDYETTRQQYHSKNQRKLMTKELRHKIMERDNYTCQICGKYMPDEVGLHIDHIVAIKNGGKTVESNLQVLCSKCNGSKGAKK